MLKQLFSLVIEFPIEFLYSDLLLRKLSILIWKAEWMPGQHNGSRIIVRKSLTTGLFSSNKAFPDGCTACHEYDTSSKTCMCVFACATWLNFNMQRSFPCVFCTCLKFCIFNVYHSVFLPMMNFWWEGKGAKSKSLQVLQDLCIYCMRLHIAFQFTTCIPVSKCSWGHVLLDASQTLRKGPEAFAESLQLSKTAKGGENRGTEGWSYSKCPTAGRWQGLSSPGWCYLCLVTVSINLCPSYLQ